MKKYSVFSLLLSLFALSSANAATCAISADNCCVTDVRYPATETTACYDATCYNAAPYAYTECDNSGAYINVIGGANWLNNRHSRDDFRLKVGYLAGGSVGYQFNNGLRLEGEISYRHNKVKGSKHTNLNSWSYMVNALYDFDLDSDYTPYIGVGIGYTNQFISVRSSDVKEQVSAKEGVAWQAIGGVSYKIDAKTSVAVEYRYLAGRDHMHNHGANVALRRMF